MKKAATKKAAASKKTAATKNAMIAEQLSILTEVQTIIETAPPDSLNKFRIDYPNVNATGCVKIVGKRNVKARIYCFGKRRAIGTFSNKKKAAVAYAIAKNKIELNKRSKKKNWDNENTRNNNRALLKEEDKNS